MKLKRVDQPVEKSYPHYNDVNSGHMLKHLIIGASLTVAVSVAGCGKKESSREKEGDSSDNMNPPAKKVEPAKKQEPAKNNVDTST
ncbi:hypothetical protein KJ865_11165, partial [Myxococcota bacterium]|nr:hypothetical protein [Myxococcota bacterium]